MSTDLFIMFPWYTESKQVVQQQLSFSEVSLLLDFLLDLLRPVLKDKGDEVLLWQTEPSWVYICLSFTDLTRIHRHCVNTREMDLYVWTWKVNTAAPCSVTGISYEADNWGKAHRDMPELKSFYPDKNRDDGESKDRAGWLKIWEGRVNVFKNHHWGWGVNQPLNH